MSALSAVSTVGHFTNYLVERYTNSNSNANNVANNVANVENRGGNNNVLNNKVNNGVQQNGLQDVPILLLILVIVICTLPAVTIAVKCNPNCPVIMGIIAFLFDRIYLFQYVIRKYYMKEKGYCK